MIGDSDHNIQVTDKLGQAIYECSDFEDPQLFPVWALSNQELSRQYSSDSIIRRQTKIMFVVQKGGRLQRELYGKMAPNENAVSLHFIQ